MPENGSLTLKRRTNERIVIQTSDGDIIITVTQIERIDTKPRVKLTISAPKCVQVDREEVYLKKKGISNE